MRVVTRLVCLRGPEVFRTHEPLVDILLIGLMRVLVSQELSACGIRCTAIMLSCPQWTNKVRTHVRMGVADGLVWTPTSIDHI